MPLPLQQLGLPEETIDALTDMGLHRLGDCLRLLAGSERIESGGWDAGVVEQDYFIAEDGHHARLWIFRELRAGRRWFLHGMFG